MTTINTFYINNHRELINKISKWNLTNQWYPDEFQKSKVKPLQNDYITMEDYRMKMEYIFYLESWEPFRIFNVRLNRREINFEEYAVGVNIKNFDHKDTPSVEDYRLYDCTFEIQVPNYFVYGYQGMHFKDKFREDPDLQRRTSGDMKKHDLIYLARVSKDYERTYYKTIVMSSLTKDYDKDLVSMLKRTNFYDYVPLIFTKRMTLDEIQKFKNEFKKKRENGDRWICCHIMTFGTIKKEFKTLDLLIRKPTLNIRKELTTGKSRNESTTEKDKSNDVINAIMVNYNLDDQLISLILKIYKNSILFKDERQILIQLLTSHPDINNFNFQNQANKIINNIHRGIFPLPLEYKKVLYDSIFASEDQRMDSEIEDLLCNTDEKTELNKTIKEVIRQYGLNSTQATILAKVEKEKFLSLIQGPPGTGKTKMILAFIYQELNNALKNQRQAKILVCAPSNTACNEITRRLKKENINTNIMTVRFIVDDSVDNSISHVTVDKVYFRKLYNMIIEDNNVFDFVRCIDISEDIVDKLSIHNENIQIKIGELLYYREQLNKYMRGSQKSNRKIVNKLYQIICQQENELDEYIQNFIDYLLLIENDDFENLYKDYIIRSAKICKQSVFEDADVIVTTLSSSNNEYFKKISHRFTLLIVDEASQASELTTLIPFCHNIPKAILIGDPKQLPPTILCEEAKNNKYGRSLFQRLQENSPDSVHLLNIQYRMHPSISKLSSRCFYSNEIINGENVKSSNWQKDWCRNSDFGPLMFYNVKGVTNRDDDSLTNVTEAYQILNFITQLLQLTPKINFGRRIAVISPYRSQVLLIRNKLRQYYREMLGQLKLDYNQEFDFSGEKIVLSNENKELIKRINILDYINVNTVDSFQGQESDIVLLSCVRSNTKSIGFLSDKRRLNVAITRARFTLIIFGNADTLCKDSNWRNIISEIKNDKRFKANANDYFKYSKRFPKNLFPSSFFKNENKNK